MVVTWDAHEVDDDWAAHVDQDDTPPEVFLLRRAAAFRAYHETIPRAAPRCPRPSICASIAASTSAG